MASTGSTRKKRVAAHGYDIPMFKQEEEDHITHFGSQDLVLVKIEEIEQTRFLTEELVDMPLRFGHFKREDDEPNTPLSANAVLQFEQEDMDNRSEAFSTNSSMRLPSSSSTSSMTQGLAAYMGNISLDEFRLPASTPARSHDVMDPLNAPRLSNSFNNNSRDPSYDQPFEYDPRYPGGFLPDRPLYLQGIGGPVIPTVANSNQRAGHIDRSYASEESYGAHLSWGDETSERPVISVSSDGNQYPSLPRPTYHLAPPSLLRPPFAPEWTYTNYAPPFENQHQWQPLQPSNPAHKPSVPLGPDHGIEFLVSDTQRHRIWAEIKNPHSDIHQLLFSRDALGYSWSNTQFRVGTQRDHWGIFYKVGNCGKLSFETKMDSIVKILSLCIFALTTTPGIPDRHEGTIYILVP